MTTAQEIAKIIRKRIPSVVDERVLPPMLDEIADWSGELVGKLATLSADDEKKVDKAWEALHRALIAETLKQLKSHAEKRNYKSN